MTIVARPQETRSTDMAGLLERYRPLVYSAARKWGQRDGMTVEDLAQEAALALWQTLQKRPDTPGALLKKVAHHAVRDALQRGVSVERPLPRERLTTWTVVSLEVLMEDKAGWKAIEGSLVQRRRHGEIPRPTEELALARVLCSELRDRLTRRQREVLDLLLQRYTGREVSRLLCLCASRTHRIIEVIRRNLRVLCEDPPPPPQPDPEWATVKEAAKVLGLSRVQVCRLCREGKVPGARKVEGRRYWYWLIPRPVRRLPTRWGP